MTSSSKDLEVAFLRRAALDGGSERQHQIALHFTRHSLSLSRESAGKKSGIEKAVNSINRIRQKNHTFQGMQIIIPSIFDLISFLMPLISDYIIVLDFYPFFPLFNTVLLRRHDEINVGS